MNKGSKLLIFGCELVLTGILFVWAAFIVGGSGGSAWYVAVYFYGGLLALTLGLVLSLIGVII